MKGYFLKVSEFSDVGIYTEDKQTMIDETQINQTFEPANDIFEGIREMGDWIYDFVSDFTNQVVAYFSHTF